MERIEDVMEKETKVSESLEPEEDTNQNNANISEVSTNELCSEVKQNGHLSSDDSLSHETEIVENGEVDVAASGAAAATSTPPSIVTCHPITNNGPVTNQSTSPVSFSPNSKPSPRGSSPQNGSNPNSAANHQHVVHVHISQGETFSVRVGEQIQRIQGPATVRMVSNNGPPLPMPMQVPPGHMVQQIVDEHGILTHVILSPQPTSMPVGGPSMTGGPNNTPPHAQYYPNYGPPYPTHHYPSHHHPTHHGASPHVHTGAPTHPHGTPPPPSCNSNPSGPVHPGPSQPNSMEGRANKQRERVKRKFEDRRSQGMYQQQTRPRINGKQKESHAKPMPYEQYHYQGNGMNGDSLPPVDTGQQAELAEERKVIQQVLSSTPDPTVSEIEARSALIQLALPEWDPNVYEIDPADFRFTLLLSDKGKEGKYKLVYSGDATEITLKDLKPATDYHLRVYTSLEDLKGNTTESVKFTTSACEPDPPSPPKLANKNKTSIALKWNSTCENGAKISTYTLEMDKGNGEFVEVYNGLQRQTRINKLQASTKYTFRLAAINSIGKSEFSEPASFYTSGSVPSQPDPPMLSEPFTTSLIISWIKHPNEDTFQLQMEDESTGHGFIAVYNGPNLSYKVKNLMRNTEYKFRLAAFNDEGQSKWSDVVTCRTKPDRPAPPPKPQIKGKIHAYNFRVVWEPPKDNGGAEITKYIVEIDDGRGYETLYEGSEREHVCDRLTPGQMYMVRVACCNVAGRSEFSEPCGATTQAVVPGQCQAPKLQGKPKATSLHLRWACPEYDGGAAVSEYAVQMVTPDNTCREVYKGRDLDCIVAGLSPGRPYLFQVRAFNRVGGGGWSDPFEVVSGAGVPDPPKAPQLVCKSAYSALVSWEPPVNNGATITEYRLEWQQKTDVTDFALLYTGPNQNYEIKGLTPATLYLFRVQAINSAGHGPYSPVGTCVTPPSSPSSVTVIRHTSTATSITLYWKEPNSNGSDITAYNLEVGDKQFTIGAVTEYTIETLSPETAYKIRIQAVNSIGVGPFSAPVRVTTRPLPPNPSKLECIAPAPNSLKLKWGDQRGLDTNHYTLEMEKEDGNFQVIYEGSSHFFKVNKLQETTNYNFRIYASNDVGSGPYSEIYTFTTTKAPPPAVRAPRVSSITQHSCSVEWPACKAVQGDSVVYLLQLQGEQEYQKIYRGEDTGFQVENLSPKTDYHLRVCAIRICEDGTEVVGAFSPAVTFTTQGHEPVSKQETDIKQESKLVEPKQLTDQQWAMIILMGFVVFAVLVAFVAQQIIKYRSSQATR